MNRSPLTAVALAVAGVLFLLYPAVRPSADSAATMASSAWVASHLFAMIGFILVSLAVLGLYVALQDRLALRATVVTWIGAGLTLPYYGAEDFGLNVIAKHVPNAMELAEEFRYGPVAVTMFAAGLVLLGIGVVMAALAVWRSGVVSKASWMPLALGFALFVPQFFGPYPVRIAHGALIAIGALWAAFELWRAPRVK